MPDWVVTVSIIYYAVAVLMLIFLLCGIDKYDGFIVEYGLYRGATMEVVVRILIAAFWLPYALFFYIRGLIRGD